LAFFQTIIEALPWLSPKTSAILIRGNSLPKLLLFAGRTRLGAFPAKGWAKKIVRSTTNSNAQPCFKGHKKTPGGSKNLEFREIATAFYWGQLDK